MAYTPINIGSAGAGALVLEPGWSIEMNEFGVDVFSGTLTGTYADCLTYAPAKYASASVYGSATLPGITIDNSFICSSRKIVGNEGKSGKVLVEYMGFLSGSPPNPVSDSVWVVDEFSESYAGSTYTFRIPAKILHTIKFAVSDSSRGAGSLGTNDVPYGSSAPTSLSFVSDYFLGGSTHSLTITVTQDGSNFTCTKDDWKKTGSIYEVTQVWEKHYHISSVV